MLATSASWMERPLANFAMIAKRTLPFAMLGFLVASPLQGETVKRAYADAAGRVHIVINTSSGGSERDQVIRQEPDGAGVENVRLADDGRTVGWLVDERTCCVSYPVPLKLVIWRDGRVLRRVRPIQAIFGWTFLKKGSEVAFHQAPLHGSENYTCQLLDVATGKRLAEWHLEKNNEAIPAWVLPLTRQVPLPELDESTPE